MTKSLVAIAIVAALGGCADDGGSSGPRTLAGTCGFPKRTIEVDISPALESFVIDDVEVANFEERKNRATLALNVPYSVQDALPRYREASKEAGFEIIQEDNEGFEAEIYMRKGADLGQVQIRGSQCRDAVRVYVSIVRNAAVPPG
ncbi:MAG: hypothetical protein ACRDKT_08445 [Actinomycetota bacterium]